jgi:hypothetical protein
MPDDDRSRAVITYIKAVFLIGDGLRPLKEAGTLCWFSDSLFWFGIRSQRDPNFKRALGYWSLFSLECSAILEHTWCMNSRCFQKIQLDQIRQRAHFESRAFGSPSPLAVNLTREEITFLIGFGSNPFHCPG